MKVTEYLAIYAACLSTIIFIWNVARTIPRFTVKIVYGIEEIDGEHLSGVYIFVQNPSPHTIHLSNISILYPYERKGIVDLVMHALKYRRFPWSVGWVFSSLSNYEIEDGCPIALESGKSHSVFVPQETLENIFEECDRREIKAVVQDQLWRSKYSPKFMVDKLKGTKIEVGT